MTQTEAAIKWRVSLPTIQNWEWGKREPVGFNRQRIEALLRRIESRKE
jgi:DNA-binding transcriptional regulator YiaG